MGFVRVYAAAFGCGVDAYVCKHSVEPEGRAVSASHGDSDGLVFCHRHRCQLQFGLIQQTQ